MSSPDEELSTAIRLVVGEVPEGFEAGPKALLAAVQAANADAFSGVSIMKFKKVLTKVKAAVKEEEEQARIEASRAKVGTIDNCPGRHGLVRFLTNHGSYCCDTCRCYLPIGAPMWGCRECDWDVCEGRCHPAGVSLSDLKARMAGLEKQTAELAAGGIDRKTKLAAVEAEVHKLEKTLDNAKVAELVALQLSMAKLTITEDDARAEKKALLARSGDLLTKIESVFISIKEKEAANAKCSEEATKVELEAAAPQEAVAA